MQTPTRFIRKCDICGDIVDDIRIEGVHQYTKGWVMNREGGGGHGISLPEREDRWAHRYCVEKKIKGHINQGNLI